MNPFRKSPATFDAKLDERDRAAELEARRAARVAEQSGAPELRRTDLEFGRFGRIVHTPTGDIFFADNAATYDVGASTPDAYYHDANGGIRFLARPHGGPRSLAEEAALRAERAAREAAPRPRPSWARS